MLVMIAPFYQKYRLPLHSCCPYQRRFFFTCMNLLFSRTVRIATRAQKLTGT